MRPSRLELVSVHIPKTAGTSFRFALEAEYGHDLAHVYNDVGLNGRTYRAVHGHFSPSQFWSAARHAKLIMWLRNPVERLVSYYDFWLSRASTEGNKNHAYFRSSNMSLSEFVTWEPIRTEFEQKYVKGLSFCDFDFIGVTERYDKDLDRLAKLLNWSSPIKACRTNVASGDHSFVEAAAYDAIKRYHSVELDWYRRAVE